MLHAESTKPISKVLDKTGLSIKDIDLPTIAGIPVVRTPHLGTLSSSAWTGSLWSTANPAISTSAEENWYGSVDILFTIQESAGDQSLLLAGLRNARFDLLSAQLDQHGRRKLATRLGT